MNNIRNDILMIVNDYEEVTSDKEQMVDRLVELVADAKIKSLLWCMDFDCLTEFERAETIILISRIRAKLKKKGTEAKNGAI